MKIGILGFVFLILFTLKLGVGDTEVVNTSWWVITAPLWIPPAIWAVFQLLAGLLTFLGWLLTSKEQRKRNAAAKAIRKYGRGL